MMTRKAFLFGVVLSIILSLSAGLRTPAQIGPAGLTGRVTSAAEGAMEGVLVSAWREGSNITTTVVTNAGDYAFPKDRLAPANTSSASVRRAMCCRGDKVVDVNAGSAKFDARLEQASLLEKALQLTSAEWLYSYPLPEAIKYATLRDCTRCHSQVKPAMSLYDAKTAAYVMQRMIYSSGSTPASLPDSRRQCCQLGPARRNHGHGTVSLQPPAGGGRGGDQLE